MKKVILGSVTLLSLVALAGCSSDKTTESKKPAENTMATEQTTTVSSIVDNSQYDAIVDELKSSLDPTNSGQVSIEIQNNVAESDYPDGHDVIQVMLTGEAKDNAQTMLDAVYSNTATTDQQNAITLFRMAISEMAKKLPNDTATIDFGYELYPDQYQLIAKSSKITDIIPVGDLILE
ncbi:MAG: hypothetical protein Q4D67_06030 [Streptococcus minor]|nr:hypothetical protein [Streptococcus minor]